VSHCITTRRIRAERLAGGILLLLVSALLACNSAPKVDTSPLDQTGTLFSGVEKLRQLDVSADEVKQLVLARQAGINDDDCVELVRLARRRGQPFNEGPGINGLMRVGFQGASVMALARLNQLGLYAGEAQAMKLAGLSEEIVLALARRRNAGQPALSGAKAAALRNAGLTNPQILNAVNRGTTDAQADAIIAQRNRAAGGTRFVRQQGVIRRR
jgi:hypothetical protein